MHSAISLILVSVLEVSGAGLVVDWPTGVDPHDTLVNREAPVPPQCYTLHEAQFNPCYVCHQDSRDGFENLQNDEGLQSAYEFSDVGFTNQWKNLFEDRSARIAAISDEEILAWVREDNYSELDERLIAAGFQGWIPDLEGLENAEEAFDSQGFAKDGSYWVAYNYKPLPSTFWPTNGATDDVMIRLPHAFRTTEEGAFSRDIYLTNLALLEATIKGFDEIGSPPINEAVVGVDLDGNQTIGLASKVLMRNHYVGGASDFEVFRTMYPKGTEFLHTVRYIDVDQAGNIRPSKRMKEVRYMRRDIEMRASWAAYLYLDEMLEKEAGKLPRHKPLIDQRALQSETGWVVSGFMEDADGRLRVNSFEETFFCMGCHNSVGATIDKTFSFPRKVDGAEGWGYIDLRGMPDAPTIGEVRGEIETYLERVGGGSEFRNNDEMRERFFTDTGALDRAAVARANDVYDLVTPSRSRALALNKAYRVIVEDQDFLFGRDPTLMPPENVYDQVPDDAPTLPQNRVFAWDIRLDWSVSAATIFQDGFE